MSDFPRWKYALVAIAMVLGILYALPNAFVPLSAVQVAATHNAPVDAALEQKIVAELQKDKIAYQNITLRHDKAKGDNILTHAPHPLADLLADGWDRPYSRERAAFPTDATRAHKSWPTVSRIDGAFGDRNLVCTCPPMEDYLG